uniref:Uncharacterized protein n=1 Tax=Neogobius melanostomus TaxID=47308 RepID=A0A8C6TGX7_9GOBI
MSAASCLLSEEELQCSICLDVLTDPVSTPCGHTFCKHCITETWRVNAPCRCPVCNEVFTRQPQLKTNIFISAMVAQFRQRAQPSVTQDHCLQHNKPLELFCESDHSCVCVLCSLQHQGHTLVPLKEACEAKQRELQKSQAHTRRMILDRTQKISEVQQSLELSQKTAEEEAAEGVSFFSALMEMIQKALDQVLQEIEEKQTKMKTEAETLIQGLEKEICELKQKSSEVEQLSRSEDHVLKTFPSLTAAQHGDWINTRTAFEIFRQNLKYSVNDGEFSVNVTSVLDSDTAHPELTVSEDLKQVSRTGAKRRLLNNSRRITGYHGVLGKQSFSSGRHYFEVQVSENRNWAVGIAKESINRKDDIYATPTNGFWTIQLVNGEYCTADPDYTWLQVKSVLQKVGVFVDYEEGLVLFYDVDTAVLLYGFTGCSFTETLCPYFFIGGRENKNSAPLIITPIQ